MRILLSAFEPFGTHAINASAEVARRIAAGRVRGATVRTVVLPVVRFEAARVLFDAFDAFRPRAVVMLGIAENRGSVTPERIAVNVDDYRLPDNGGNAPVDESIAEDGPVAYLSTLPVRAMTAALAGAGVPASLSNSAGTYLCNHIFYAMMHRLATTDSKAIAGFVHIPQMSEAYGNEDGAPPALPLDTLVRAVRITLDAVVASMPAARTRR
jgi:pyroglutamyl-peptidase